MTLRRFHCPPENFSSANAFLDEAESRHLKNVLRLRVDDEIAVFNGAGREFICRVGRVSGKRTELHGCVETTPASPESSLDLTLCAAVLKGEKFDLVIQKAVELGVTRLIPLLTRRTDAVPKNSGARLERWRRIVMEASKQSGRAKLMQIAIPETFDAVIKGQKMINPIIFAEREGESFAVLPENFSGITAFIGPEGGWADSELELAKKAGMRIITFGGRILRAETAAICIAAVLQNRFGDFC